VTAPRGADLGAIQLGALQAIFDGAAFVAAPQPEFPAAR
jgi:hypothetical protein